MRRRCRTTVVITVSRITAAQCTRRTILHIVLRCILVVCRHRFTCVVLRLYVITSTTLGLTIVLFSRTVRYLIISRAGVYRTRAGFTHCVRTYPFTLIGRVLYRRTSSTTGQYRITSITRHLTTRLIRVISCRTSTVTIPVSRITVAAARCSSSRPLVGSAYCRCVVSQRTRTCTRLSTTSTVCTSRTITTHS